MATDAQTMRLPAKRKGLALAYERVLMYDFAVLERHRHQMNASLRKAVRDADARWNQVRDRISDEGELESWAERCHETAELLPRLQWNAQFILAYATFEHALNQLCLLAEGQTKSAIDFRSYGSGKHRGIIKAQKYLEEVAGIADLFKAPEWTAALHLNKLRNVIAHTNGEFSDPPTKDQEEARRLFKDWSGVIVIINADKTPQRFRLTAEFVHSAIQSLWSMLEKICRAEPSAAKVPGSGT